MVSYMITTTKELIMDFFSYFRLSLFIGFLVAICFLYGYYMSLSLAGILLGYGVSEVVAVVFAGVVTIISSMFLTPLFVFVSNIAAETVTTTCEIACEVASSVVSKVESGVDSIVSFFKEKKEEFDAYVFNKNNGVVKL